MFIMLLDNGTVVNSRYVQSVSKEFEPGNVNQVTFVFKMADGTEYRELEYRREGGTFRWPLLLGDLVPAAPGFEVVFMNKGGDSGDETVFSTCVIAWEIDDWKVRPITDEEDVTTSFTWAIKRPNGTVFIPGDHEWSTLAGFVEYSKQLRQAKKEDREDGKKL